jgi:hypothetical protein
MEQFSRNLTYALKAYREAERIWRSSETELKDSDEFRLGMELKYLVLFFRTACSCDRVV